MILCLSLTAQTNDTIDFYDQTYAIAWTNIGTPKFENGWICFPKPEVVTARLLIWKYFFGTHPFQNRYESDMFELEALAEDYRIRLHNLNSEFNNYKRTRRKRTAIICSIVSAAVAIPCTVGGIKLGLMLQR